VPKHLARLGTAAPVLVQFALLDDDLLIKLVQVSAELTGGDIEQLLS
jgi:hypothetical protein